MSIAWITAFWLGLLTAISPCPLATNIAAVLLIGHQAGRKQHVLLAGFLYTIGRMLVYLALSMLVAGGVMANATVSRFLQKHMNEVLGPILILLGMILMGWIGSGVSWNIAGEGIQKRAKSQGLRWAFPVGVLFALSFCPVSAGLFFAGLIPLSIQHESLIALPVIYTVGTSLPVIVFAALLAFAAGRVGTAYDRLAHVEKWVRYGTGCVFILVGVYYCLIHVYGITF